MALSFTTAGLRPVEVESYWKEVVCSTYVPLQCSIEARRNFEASISAITLGRSQISQTTTSASRYVRTQRELRRAETDDYLVCLLNAGENRFSQLETNIEAKAGDIFIIDTGRPYVLDCPTHYSATLLKVPRKDLLTRLPCAERMPCMRVSSEGHFAKLAASMLLSAASILENDVAEGGTKLAGPILDLLALAFDESYAAAEQDRTRYTRIVERAQSEILDHLFDPDFEVSSVPTAIGVSIRTLSRAFAQIGTTPSRWLWQMRLERARDILAASSEHSVSEVALLCGFNDISHFSRAFKRRFSVTPSRVGRRGLR